MKALKYFFMTLVVSLSLTSCMTSYARYDSDDEIYSFTNPSVTYELVVSCGTPFYYNGCVSYYLYNGWYYYPYIWNDIWYFQPYRHVRPIGFVFIPNRHFRPNHHLGDTHHHHNMHNHNYGSHHTDHGKQHNGNHGGYNGHKSTHPNGGSMRQGQSREHFQGTTTPKMPNTTTRGTFNGRPNSSTRITVGNGNNTMRSTTPRTFTPRSNNNTFQRSSGGSTPRMSGGSVSRGGSANGSHFGGGRK